MRYPISFMKVSGAGNDFVLIDLIHGKLDADPALAAQVLCSRPFGIGADGLLLLEPSSRADFRMRYFNADGSYGGMCGNGGRCIAMSAYRLGYVPVEMRFEALDHIYRARIHGNRVALAMKNPSGLRRSVTLELPGNRLTGGFVDTGSPHAVLFVEDLDSIDIASIGRKVRFDRLFAPAGANANFVRVVDAQTIALRTYERGVEAETLACGTGSVASAVVATALGLTKPPVAVKVRSGETLTVSFDQDGDNLTNVMLEGSAHILFCGNVLLDDTSHSIHALQP